MGQTDMDALTSPMQLLAFTLEDRKFALYLSAVEKVLRSVRVTPLPEGPAIVLGIFSFGGRVLPVLNVRKRFHLEDSGIGPDNCFILARTARWTVALAVDAVVGVLADMEAPIPPDRILPKMEYVQGVKQVGSDILLIHDLETFLSLEEEADLGKAMSGHA